VQGERDERQPVAESRQADRRREEMKVTVPSAHKGS
jgi:hypothetical protein